MDAPKTLENTDPPTPSVLTSTNQVERTKRTWRGVLRDIFVYLFLYILISGVSIGPFFWSWHGAVYADGSKWIARFYQPLAFLCEVCPPLRWLVNEWVNKWIL